MPFYKGLADFSDYFVIASFYCNLIKFTHEILIFHFENIFTNIISVTIASGGLDFGHDPSHTQSQKIIPDRD